MRTCSQRRQKHVASTAERTQSETGRVKTDSSLNSQTCSIHQPCTVRRRDWTLTIDTIGHRNWTENAKDQYESEPICTKVTNSLKELDSAATVANLDGARAPKFTMRALELPSR